MDVKMRIMDEINWVQSLSLPDLMRIARGCQKFAEEGKSCEECSHFKRNKCSGRDFDSYKISYYDNYYKEGQI